MCCYTTLYFIVNRLFSYINVSQDSAATYASSGGIFSNQFTANLPKNLPVTKNENLLRFDRIVAWSLWPHFFWPTCYSVTEGWLGSRVVSVLDSGAEGTGFKSQPRRCWVTDLGKLFTPLCLCSPSSEIGSSPFKGCEGNCGPGGK